MLNGDLSNRQSPIIAIDISSILLKEPKSLFKRLLGASDTYSLDKHKIALINALWQKLDCCIYLVRRWDSVLSEEELQEILGNKVNYTRIDSIESMQELNNKCKLTYMYFFYDEQNNEVPFMENVFPCEGLTNLL